MIQIKDLDLHRETENAGEGTSEAFLPSSHRTFAKTDHVLGHQTHLNRVKKSYKEYSQTTVELGYKRETERYLESPDIFGN